MIDRDYQLFAEVVDAGSLSAGARTLGMPLATVSRKLAELEAHLNARLITRSTRKLVDHRHARGQPRAHLGIRVELLSRLRFPRRMQDRHQLRLPRQLVASIHARIQRRRVGWQH